MIANKYEIHVMLYLRCPELPWHGFFETIFVRSITFLVHN